MDQTFIFSGSGPGRKTLKQLRHGAALENIIDKFVQMIQSSKDLALDEHRTITFYALIPPTKYRYKNKIISLFS